MSHMLMGLAIVAAGLAADGPKAEGVRAQYEALVKEYEAAVKVWEARFNTAREADKVDLVARYRDWPGWPFAPRILALAEAHPDDPAAVDALLWVVALRNRVGAFDREIYTHYERALALLGDHLQDPRLDGEVYRTVGWADTPGAEAFLRATLERGRDRDARGFACVALAELLAIRREIARDPWFDHPKSDFQRLLAGRIDPRLALHIRSSDPASLLDEAARLYVRADREFGNVVVMRRGVAAGTVGDQAKAGLRDLLILSVGCIAPDVEGPDASGERLSLRDHRGKVVVLAVTNPGAVVHHRALRDLLARHKGEPFAVLGLSVSPKKADLDAAIKAGDVTWRCWWNDFNGPIVSAFIAKSTTPPFFVIDAEGVIRARGSRIADLDDTIDRLLGERKAEAKP